MRSKGAWLGVVSRIEGEEPVGTIEHCGGPSEDTTLVEDFFLASTWISAAPRSGQRLNYAECQ